MYRTSGLPGQHPDLPAQRLTHLATESLYRHGLHETSSAVRGFANLPATEPTCDFCSEPQQLQEC